MLSPSARRLFHSLASLAFVSSVACALAEPAVKVTPRKPDGVYKTGEKIFWDVRVTGDEAAPIKDASYVLRKGGATEIGKGTLHFEQGGATIETALNEPGTILAEITVPAPGPGQKEIRALGGAAIAPEQIKPSMPCPNDFDAFWQLKIAELNSVPENAVLEKGDSGKPGVDYWDVTMDNIRGTHIRGQLARPAGDKKAPAMLIVQWAGVYPMPKAWVTERAAEGWLVLNISAHDLPIHEPDAFYDEQKKGPLNNYTSIGKEDREKSYFVRMFLSCYRAVNYLSERPDWDGKTLVTTGASQGGLHRSSAPG